MCGGTFFSLMASAVAGGLSPRVRGNPEVLVGLSLVLGSIPACAGEPGGERDEHFDSVFYPRVCGGT